MPRQPPPPGPRPPLRRGGGELRGPPLPLHPTNYVRRAELCHPEAQAHRTRPYLVLRAPKDLARRHFSAWARQRARMPEPRRFPLLRPSPANGAGEGRTSGASSLNAGACRGSPPGPRPPLRRGGGELRAPPLPLHPTNYVRRAELCHPEAQAHRTRPYLVLRAPKDLARRHFSAWARQRARMPETRRFPLPRPSPANCAGEGRTSVRITGHWRESTSPPSPGLSPINCMGERRIRSRVGDLRAGYGIAGAGLGCEDGPRSTRGQPSTYTRGSISITRRVFTSSVGLERGRRTSTAW